MTSCVIEFALVGMLCGQAAPESPAQHAVEVQSLINDLSSENPRERERAATALGDLGSRAEAAAPQLVALLVDDRVAPYASDALVKIGAGAAPALIAALEAEDARLRIWTCYALGKIGAPARKALSALEAHVASDAEKVVRGFALSAYVEIQTDPAAKISIAKKSSHDEDPDVRGLAARTLGQLGPGAASAAPELVRLLQDTGYRWRPIVIDSIGQRAVRYDAAESPGMIGAQAAIALDPLSKMMLEDADPEVRASAALAVCRIDPKCDKGLDALIAILKDDKRGTAGPEEAANSLAALGARSRPALVALAESLNHEDMFVRLAVIDAIAAIGCEEAVTALCKALSDHEEQVRESAARALATMGPVAKGALLELQRVAEEDSDEGFVSAAVEAIERIRAED